MPADAALARRQPFFAFYDGNATRYGSPDQHDKSANTGAIRSRLPTVLPHRTMAPYGAE
jgi:hypothetical protein